MNYAAIRDAIHAQLLQVPGIGVVFKHQRYSSDWPTFLERYKVPNALDQTEYLVNVAWISRMSTRDTSASPGGRAEDNTLVAVHVEDIWTITLIYGFHDDEESTQASESAFMALVDKVKEQFRWLDRLGIPTAVEYAEPVEAVSLGLYMIGDTLCHKADMQIRVVQFTT